MFQKSLNLLFIIALLFQASAKMFVYVQWFKNQEFIAKNLCENRDKPELKCHGKCKLMKAMAALEQKEQSNEKNQNTQLPNFLQEVFFTDKINFLPQFSFQDFSFQEKISNHFYFNHSFKDAYLASSWHPPTTLV
jgi:hypothetical protein